MMLQGLISALSLKSMVAIVSGTIPSGLYSVRFRVSLQTWQLPCVCLSASD